MAIKGEFNRKGRQEETQRMQSWEHIINHRGNREKDAEKTEIGHKGDLTAKGAKKKRKEYKVGRILF
ncbi:hypothetical protein ACFE6N_04305 [Pedobacter sp. BG31]|uniref:hypothetical protein n=1 Tax=Pedobacter sp. BG31 TaxID=3349697 RepID=UPI0035F3BD95